MKHTFVYSGTFDPPTLGHLSLLEEAAKNFDTILVVPSDHGLYPIKFSQEERVALWNTYPLPAGVVVETFEDFSKRDVPNEEIVLIRGIRSEEDGEHEARVLLASSKNASITKTFTLVAKDTTKHISSSLVWSLANKKDVRALAQLVSPLVLQSILNKKNPLS